MNENLIEALHTTSYTLVGYFGEFPRKHGNCFSVEGSDKKQYKILNFNHENIEELVNRGIVSFPIKISVLSNKHAVIVDGRIPNEWYSNGFCEICTPHDLLPAPQRVKQILDIQRGIRTETKWEMDGEVFGSVFYKIEAQPGLVKVPFKYEVGEAIMIDAFDFKPKKSLLSRYSLKKINELFYGKIKLSGGTDTNL